MRALKPGKQPGERCAKVMRNVIANAPHLIHEAFDLAEHEVDLVDQPIEITGATLGRQTARQITVHDPLNRERHRVDAADRCDSGHGCTRKTQQRGDQATP